MMKDKTKQSIIGLLIAIAISGTWGTSLYLLLTVDFSSLHPGMIILAIAWMTFLYTGLFITAHDGMHGSLFPKQLKVSHTVGAVAVFLYAMFSFNNLLQKHWQHHKHPASAKDPDYHDGAHKGFFRWYIHFIRNYLTYKQLLGMAIAFNIFLHVFKIPTINLVLFWVAPSLLSTFQLFYFGTYLVHKESGEPFKDHHRARSNNYSLLLSFLSCYHFGYHWEHHAYPNVPWWRLPEVRN